MISHTTKSVTDLRIKKYCERKLIGNLAKKLKHNMNTSWNYRMLYIYFFEVSNDFIDRMFRRMQVARDDQGVYEYFLKKWLLEKISEFDLAEKKK